MKPDLLIGEEIDVVECELLLRHNNVFCKNNAIIRVDANIVQFLETIV